jgi:glycolate oxidase FAD binding subunit
VLEAPRTCKQQIDVWGEVGAVALMGRIKNQFDPQGVLSPGRFVAGL